MSNGSTIALALLSCCDVSGAPCKPSLPALASAAALTTAAAPAVATPAPAPRPETVAPAPRFATPLGIADLEGVVRASGVTTAMLGGRAHDSEIELPGDLRVVTRCGAHGCVDGLVAGRRTLIPAALAAAEEKALRDGDGYFLERVVRVPWSDERHVSAYVAESELSGGAHANNHLSCRTFERAGGRALMLADVLPPRSAALLLAKVQALLDDPNAAIDAGLGFDASTDWSRYHVTPTGFRFASAPGDAPAILLCAEGTYPLASDSMLEIDPDAVPVRFLLR